MRKGPGSAYDKVSPISNLLAYLLPLGVAYMPLFGSHIIFYFSEQTQNWNQKEI